MNVVINLPFFPGFYESSLSQTLDYAKEREAEYNAERETSQQYHPETYQPEELRLDSCDYGEILMDCVNYRDAHEAMARDYVESFDNWAADSLGTPADSFVFESMTSPREYNFSTDQVYAIVPLAVMESLHRSTDAAKLAALITQRHSSRDGFISFYANDLESWEAKPFDEWDHNEMGTMLCAAIAATGASDTMRDEIEYPIYEAYHEYLDKHCDWAKFERLAREKRAEKLAEWIRADAMSARAYVATAADVAEIVDLALGELDSDEAAIWFDAADESRYRCPYTLDLFAKGRQA